METTWGNDVDGYPPDVEDSESGIEYPPAVAPTPAPILTPPLVKTRAARHQRKILMREKERKVLELRKGGAGFDQIAQAVGYKDASGASKALKRAMGKITQEPAIELRSLQIERLNHMLLVLWPQIQTGDQRAIQTSLSVMDKLDRLMGTEAATQVDVNVNNQNAVLVIDGNSDDYISAMARMAGINPDGTNIMQAIEASGDNGNGLDIIDAEEETTDTTEGDTTWMQDEESAGTAPAPDGEVGEEEPVPVFDFDMDPAKWT